MPGGFVFTDHEYPVVGFDATRTMNGLPMVAAIVEPAVGVTTFGLLGAGAALLQPANVPSVAAAPPTTISRRQALFCITCDLPRHDIDRSARALEANSAPG